ncbi:MAG: hypothetical protein CMN10_03870 [Roseobacter sp.]|nr:hypothetical protein [Roseobacter sp.]
MLPGFPGMRTARVKICNMSNVSLLQCENYDVSKICQAPLLKISILNSILADFLQGEIVF